MNFLRRRNPGSQWEDNLNEELHFHLEKQMTLYISAGLSAEEARRQALLEFGGVESVKEECREHRKAFLLETLWTDLRYALRMLRMNLGFTAIAVLTLALGMGANTAIFSVLDAVVLKPLPYPQADRLALIWTEMKRAGQSRAPSSGPDLLDIRHRAKLLQDAGGIWVGSAAVTGTGEPEQIKLGFTTANFLSLLGIPPAKGRLFNAQDELENAGPVIIITDGLWRRKFWRRRQYHWAFFKHRWMGSDDRWRHARIVPPSFPRRCECSAGRASLGSLWLRSLGRAARFELSSSGWPASPWCNPSSGSRRIAFHCSAASRRISGGFQSGY